ncbi:hypothetical protein pb186bvf_007410 [Paramecium bursaria]
MNDLREERFNEIDKPKEKKAKNNRFGTQERFEKSQQQIVGPGSYYHGTIFDMNKQIIFINIGYKKQGWIVGNSRPKTRDSSVPGVGMYKLPDPVEVKIEYTIGQSLRKDLQPKNNNPPPNYYDQSITPLVSKYKQTRNIIL